MSGPEIEEIVSTIEGLAQVVPMTLEMHHAARKLAAVTQYTIYDSQIVAAAAFGSCSTVLSEDMQDGRVYNIGDASVRVVNPFVQVVGEYCPACGEGVFDAATSRAISADMKAFGKQVNAAIVDPSFISKVRKKLDLDQREAAEIFGGGANAFSRYENGKTKPPLALVKLHKVYWTAIPICSLRCGRGEGGLVFAARKSPIFDECLQRHKFDNISYVK
jgi:putative zinc finger/helix-turn-helix YgiT family protein